MESSQHPSAAASQRDAPNLTSGERITALLIILVARPAALSPFQPHTYIHTYTRAYRARYTRYSSNTRAIKTSISAGPPRLAVVTTRV